MRVLTIAAIAIAGFMLSVTSASVGVAAPSARCPADASEASYSIWGANSIKTGHTVTGTHRCGRRMLCTGGSPGHRQSRRCRWL